MPNLERLPVRLHVQPHKYDHHVHELKANPTYPEMSPTIIFNVAVPDPPTNFHDLIHALGAVREAVALTRPRPSCGRDHA